jgi:hypothetical protein
MVQIKIASVVFLAGNNAYINDLDENNSLVYNPRVPFSLYSATNNTLAEIYGAGNGEVTKIAGQEISNDFGGTPVCSDTDAVRPRILRFLNRNGESLTVPVQAKEVLVAIANEIINLLGNTDFGDPVCVELVGERQVDTSEIVGADFNGVPIEVANNSRFYTGGASYQLDDPETTLELPLKVASPDGENPPEAIEDAWDSCVGDLRSSRGCGRRGTRYTPRKFTAQYLIGTNTGGENVVEGDASNEIPALQRDRSAIISCGQAIANAVGGALFCLPYEGESDNRFHLRDGVEID